MDFQVRIDIDGSVLQETLRPLFTASELVTVRLPLPLELPAEAAGGVIRVTANGNGMRIGDVLRCFTTAQRRMGDTFGLFAVAKLKRCLFVADGQPPDRVIEALTANTPEITENIVLVVERPLHGS
jgi:hypothetical protein